MTLGTKLSQLRRNRKLSQSEISNHLEVSQTAYSKWESDQSKPSINNLFKICEFYEEDIYSLYDKYHY